MDFWLRVDHPPEAEVHRLAALEQALANYGFKGDHLFIRKCYEDYKRSAVYPFTGGRGEQPQWVLDDFDTLALLEEREYLRKKHGGTPTLKPGQPAVPTFEKLFNRSPRK